MMRTDLIVLGELPIGTRFSLPQEVVDRYHPSIREHYLCHFIQLGMYAVPELGSGLKAFDASTPVRLHGFTEIMPVAVMSNKLRREFLVLEAAAVAALRGRPLSIGSLRRQFRRTRLFPWGRTLNATLVGLQEQGLINSVTTCIEATMVHGSLEPSGPGIVALLRQGILKAGSCG